jgi:leader peptidase (prepilin peptidase) / N-methyltransferase
MREQPLALADFPPWFLRVFAGLFGLLWGSFLNVVIARVPLGMSVVRPPSHCFACQTPVKAYDNIPVLSYLLLGGKARCCGAPFSVRYPLVELIGGLLSVAVFERLVLTLDPAVTAWHALAVYLCGFAFCLSLVAAAFIDLDHLYIPDAVPYGGTLLGIATASFRELSFTEAAFGALLGFVMVWLPFDVLYRLIRGRTGMARGDAKLVMMAGAFFGWKGAFFALVGGSIQAILATLVLLLTRGKIDDAAAVERERAEILAEIAALPEAERAEAEAEMKADPIFEEGGSGMAARLAFGPFLALAMMEYLLVGPRLVEWLIALPEPGP